MPYIAAQLVGAMLAAALLYLIYGGFLAAKEREKQVVRGEAGSQVTAMCYCEYFPNPGALATSPGPYNATAAAELAGAGHAAGCVRRGGAGDSDLRAGGVRADRRTELRGAAVAAVACVHRA